jgi:hypothetical protein
MHSTMRKKNMTKPEKQRASFVLMDDDIFYIQFLLVIGLIYKNRFMYEHTTKDDLVFER